MLKITDQEFKQLTAYIKQNFGIHLQAEKKTMLTGRLQSLLLSKNFTRFSEYIDYLLNDKSGEARMSWWRRLPPIIPFMREADHFFSFVIMCCLNWCKAIRNRTYEFGAQPVPPVRKLILWP